MRVLRRICDLNNVYSRNFLNLVTFRMVEVGYSWGHLERNHLVLVCGFNSAEEVVVAVLHKGIVSEISGGPWGTSEHTGFMKASQIKMEDGKRIIGPIVISDLLKSIMLEGEEVEFSVYKNIFFIPFVSAVRIVKTGESFKSKDAIMRNMLLGYLALSPLLFVVAFIAYMGFFYLFKNDFLANFATAVTAPLMFLPLLAHLRSWRSSQALVDYCASDFDATMSNGESGWPMPRENKSGGLLSWLPVVVFAIIIAIWLGPLGGLATLGLYGWLKPKIGILLGVALAGAISVVIVFVINYARYAFYFW